MNRASLTVFFEDPFWVGIYEREADEAYEVCRIVFGAEPKDYEVNCFLLQNWSNLRFAPSTKAEQIAERHFNPKRMQRDIRKQKQHMGIGTRAQQALKLQQEQGKAERRDRFRQKRESEKEYRYELRQAKQKEKHRGH